MPHESEVHQTKPQARPRSAPALDPLSDEVVLENQTSQEPAAFSLQGTDAPRSLSPSDVIHLQQTAGNRATLQLLRRRSPDHTPIAVTQHAPAAGPSVQRWSIETFASQKGHELITAETVAEYNAHADEGQQIPPGIMAELAEGSRWNDLLGHANLVGMGIAAIGSKGSLAHQSHEGSLQFLHGMATEVAEQAWQTQRKIMLWAEFCYKLVTSQISAHTKLRDVNISAVVDFSGNGTSIADLFAAWGDHTIAWLFTEREQADEALVGQRAMGSMLHMLQDTFCVAHVQRVAGKWHGEETRRIRGFNSYTQQSANKVGGLTDKYENRHAMADALNSGNARQTAGANEAIDIGAKVLRYAVQFADWDEVVKPYLLTVFALVPELEAQAPGNLGAAEDTKGRRITSAAGRQFREPWLSVEFKKNSSPGIFSRRPAGLVTIDTLLTTYERLLKLFELDTVAAIKADEARVVELNQELAAIQAATQAARDWKQGNSASRDKDMQVRIGAIDILLPKLEEDRNEVQMDIQSLLEAQMAGAAY